MIMSSLVNLPLPVEFPFPLLDLKKSITELPAQPDFVLPTLGLVLGTVGGLVAPGGTGKSWLALQLAAQIACGLDLLGVGSLKKGKVLLLCAEDPSDIISQRVHILSQHMSVEQKNEFIQNTFIVPCLGEAGNFLDDGATASKIINSGDNDFRIVIIDTLSRWHNGEENDRKDAAAVMRQMERIAKTGPAIIFIHHVGKTAVASQQQASRGSSVWVDESRWIGYLEAVPNDEAKKICGSNLNPSKLVRFGVSKSNYAACPDPILLKRGAHGELLRNNLNLRKDVGEKSNTNSRLEELQAYADF